MTIYKDWLGQWSDLKLVTQDIAPAQGLEGKRETAVLEINAQKSNCGEDCLTERSTSTLNGGMLSSLREGIRVLNT